MLVIVLESLNVPTETMAVGLSPDFLQLIAHSICQEQLSMSLVTAV